MTSTKKRIWVLADQYIGNFNQCVGVAEALGFPYQIKRVSYNAFARLPNVLLGATFIHLRREEPSSIVAPWPDIVISAGRRTVPIVRAIKRASRGRSFLVQTMWPGYPVEDLDLIATPWHDRVSERPNLVRTIGAPHNVTKKRLVAAADEWGEQLSGIPRPRIALLVGGNTRRHRFTTTMAKTLARQISQLVDKWEGGLMVSTSRRTDPSARTALLDNIDTKTEVYVWRDEFRANPYLGYLALSDAVVVTGDSTSMCTEASATGRPVYIFAPSEATAPKHQRLHKLLYDNGTAQPLSEAFAASTLTESSYVPINDAVAIAQEIKRRIGL